MPQFGPIFCDFYFAERLLIYSHFSRFLSVVNVLTTLILPLFFPFSDLMISIVCRYLVGPGGPGGF